MYQNFVVNDKEWAGFTLKMEEGIPVIHEDRHSWMPDENEWRPIY